jgi:hypothetical protein
MGLILMSAIDKQTTAFINPQECDFGIVNPPLQHVSQGAINARLC